MYVKYMWQSAVNPVAALTPSSGLRQVPHPPHHSSVSPEPEDLQNEFTGHAFKHGPHVHDNEEIKKGLQDTVDGLEHAMQGLGLVAMAGTAYGAAVNWKRDPRLRNDLVKIGSFVAIWEIIHMYRS